MGQKEDVVAAHLDGREATRLCDAGVETIGTNGSGLRSESTDADCGGAAAPMQQSMASTLDPDCEGAVSQGDGSAGQHSSLAAAAAQAIAG
ncbi:MAG: hypothetical protein ACT4O5_11105 [Gammaproteobacteria bacterium]